MKTDGDFEDREGHQAPVTLRICDSRVAICDRSALLFELPNDGVKLRPFAGRKFGMERFAIGADFEGPAARWNQGERRDAIAELEDLSRQTDGFRRVVSNRAVFDSDFGFHQELLPEAKLLDRKKRSRRAWRAALAAYTAASTPQSLGGGGVGRAFARVGVENPLAQAERFWRDLDVLVGADILDRTLETHLERRVELDAFAVALAAHVR